MKRATKVTNESKRIMRMALFILPLLFFTMDRLHAQKTYSVSLWDGDMFYSRQNQFRHKPTLVGKYIVLDYKDVSKRRVWRVFYVDKIGRRINKNDYCCPLEEMRLGDTIKTRTGGFCDEKDVFILNELVIYGFRLKRADTITVRSYKKNGRFDKPIKKSLSQAHNLLTPFSDIVQFIPLHYTTLCAAYDYEVTIEPNDTFRITDIKTANYKPDDTQIGSFCTMYSYKINGKKVISNYITLVRPGFEKGYEDYQRK